jgi:hypothetical protein
MPTIGPIVKTFRNLELTISPDEHKVYLRPNPNLETSAYIRLETMLLKAATDVSPQELSKLIHRKGYSKKLASDIFTRLDCNVKVVPSKEEGIYQIGFLPQLKVEIKRGLDEYKWTVENKSERIFKSDEPLSFIVNPEA